MLLTTPLNLREALLAATPTDAGYRYAYTKRLDYLAELEPASDESTVAHWTVGVAVHRQAPREIALDDPRLRAVRWTSEGDEKPGRQQRKRQG
jgi:hypothetical protein